MFSDPKRVIEQFMIGEGSRVADLGAGSGAYALAAAQATGPDGLVYAVEVQKDLLPRIQNSAKALGLRNVEVIWADAEPFGGTKLRDGSVDAAIAANILFQVEDRDAFAQEAKRILKPRGKLLLVDWSGSFGGAGPEPAAVVSAGDGRKLFERFGFAHERDIAAGAHHWGMVLRKS
jgi:ubiquinone/menaquinone biosynthesis C-methylase UbiE